MKEEDWSLTIEKGENAMSEERNNQNLPHQVVTVEAIPVHPFAGYPEIYANYIAEKVIEKQEERAKGIKQTGVTLGALFAVYIEEYAKKHTKTWRDMERNFKNNFGVLADRDCGLIERLEVQRWFNEIAEEVSETTANRAIELLVMIYNKAIEWELVSRNPGSKIRKYVLQSRERFLQADEFPRWFAAVNSLRYDVARDFFLMCLFTGQRRGNVMKMRWDSIDLERGVWYLKYDEDPAKSNLTKNGASHVVPLMPEAMAVLLARKGKRQNDWVFNSNGPTGHYRKPENAWGAVIRKADLTEHLTIHDLRRSHLSWMAITGANISAIASTANHKSLESTAIYARLNDQAVRKAMGNSVDAMLRAAGVQLDRVDRTEQPAAGLAPIMPTLGDHGEWITERQTAELLNVPDHTLANWRRSNDAPPWMKKGCNILYHAPSVVLWQSARNEQPKSRKEVKANPNRPGKKRRRNTTKNEGDS